MQMRSLLGARDGSGGTAGRAVVAGAVGGDGAGQISLVFADPSSLLLQPCSSLSCHYAASLRELQGESGSRVSEAARRGALRDRLTSCGCESHAAKKSAISASPRLAGRASCCRETLAAAVAAEVHRLVVPRSSPRPRSRLATLETMAKHSTLASQDPPKPWLKLVVTLLVLAVLGYAAKLALAAINDSIKCVSLPAGSLAEGPS